MCVCAFAGEAVTPVSVRGLAQRYAFSAEPGLASCVSVCVHVYPAARGSQSHVDVGRVSSKSERTSRGVL